MFPNDTNRNLTLKRLRSAVAVNVMITPCSGMAVMEAENTLTRKTRFVRAQNIVHKEPILFVIMTHPFCKVHPRKTINWKYMCTPRVAA
jgi:hypothetical protein